MKIFNVIYKSDADDNYKPVEDKTSKCIYVSYEDGSESKKSLQENILWIIKKQKLNPSDEVMDFLNAAISVYTADQLVSRDRYGYRNWSRYFKLHLPVVGLRKWEKTKEDFQTALNFLTGDHWELFFRSRKSSYEEIKKSTKEKAITKVSLLSGGLDSFIGVTDLLSSGEDIAVVGHHKSQGFENQSQSKLIELLKSEFKNREIKQFLFNAQPIQQNNKYGKEASSRARSILFIGLGITVANSFGKTIPLYIPENGLISLNIPLTYSRIGSSSTRTTHPYFLNLLESVLNILGIKNKIINPYQFRTKGEMIEDSNSTFIRNHFNETVSCAHPNSKNVNVKRSSPDQRNCGYCTPCLIRRAALKSVNLDNENHYVYSINENQLPYKDDIGRDLRAFKMGIARLKKNKPNLSLHVLRSGPIPNKNEDLQKYVRVYEKGMEEVANLIK